MLNILCKLKRVYKFHAVMLKSTGCRFALLRAGLKLYVGATQAIEMIKLAPYPFSLSVLLNANYADGIDTSWIWDADFEQITDMDIPEINAGGVRHSEIARRLRVTGYPADKITETTGQCATVDVSWPTGLRP